VNVTVKELVGGVTQLTSFPDVAFRIDELLSDENSSAADIGALIETDPALSAALLRVANSAAYSMGGTVSSVERAVTVVGLREVRDLSFGLCASNTFEGISNDLISVEDFWKHSLCCAVAAQKIARMARVCVGESLFTAGLLHDIGHLVMFSQQPELSRDAIQASLEQNDGLTPYLSEREIFGFDHMEVGTELATQWNLPDILKHCMQYHHDPFCVEQPIDAVRVVHLANSVAVLAELDSGNLDDAPPINERVISELRFSLDHIPGLVEETQEAVEELIGIFVS